MPYELTILGSSSAIPTVEKNPTAQLLNANERFFLIDCAEGTQIQLRKYKFKFQKISRIFISHLHGDHYFGLIGLIYIIGGSISGIWVLIDYLEDEYVNKVPTAMLATGFMLLGFGSMGIGILLNTISYRFRENMCQLHKIIRSR